MSDILLRWLGEEVGIEIGDVEKDFANGYIWGQLFSHFHLQPDFEKFENKRTPDAMVNNYTRLQPTFKRLGVAMNTRTANSMMREEGGVAMRLLYSVKQNLGTLNKDLEKYKNTGRLGKEFGVSTEVNRTLLEASQFRAAKETYEQGNMRFFEETLIQKVPTTAKAMMESMHLRRFTERQYKQEAAAAAALDSEVAAGTAKRQTFHDTTRSTLTGTRNSKTKQLERDAAVHASLMKRKEEAEREELRVELALAEATRRRKAEMGQMAAQDVAHGIDTFEINMKRLLKGDNNGDEQLEPATTHSPLEHQTKLRSMATSTAKLLEEMAGYMGGVRSQRADDLATKREREARRRRMLVEQQQAAQEAELKAESEELLSSLMREANEEQKLAERLWQLGQEKEVIRENRLVREKQYAERRAQDWDHALKQELEMHRSMQDQYRAQTQAELAAWAGAQQQRKAARTEKHAKMCEGVAWQLVAIAERAAEHREKTGQNVPRNEWRKWLTMFIHNDPHLGPTSLQISEKIPALDDALAKAAVADWLSCQGEFEREQAGPIAPHNVLGVMVAELDKQCRQTLNPEQQLSAMQQLPLKLAVVGAPFAGKTSVAHALATEHRLRVIEPEAIMQTAVEAAQAWSNANSAVVADTNTAAETGGNEAATIPEPSQLIKLGLEVLTTLKAGLPVSDETLVNLVVLAMEETVGWIPPTPKPAATATKGKPSTKPGKAAPEEPAGPAQGFILDGFPRTAAQAAMLEKLLTGLDLEAEQKVVDAASKLVPPPNNLLPQLDRVLVSGLDAVITLGLTDPETALKRALGRRLDPETGRVYHLEFDPPPAATVGVTARLQDVSDPSNDAVQMQQRLLAYNAVATPLDAWHQRFTRLRRPIEGAGKLTDVIAAANDATKGVLRAKAAVDSCRAAADAAGKAQAAAEKAREYAELAQTHAKGAALELLVAKKAEIQAQALLDGTAEPPAQPGKKEGKAGKGQAAASAPDPAAVELLKAQSAAKCAEQLKVCRGAAADAAGYAERAHGAAATASEAAQRAKESLGDAEELATAEVQAKSAAVEAETARAAAAEAAKQAEVAKQAAEQACREALRISELPTVEPDAELDLSVPAAAQDTTAVPAAENSAELQGDVTGSAADTQAVSAPPALPVMPPQLAEAFLQEFHHIEQSYLDGVAMTLTHVAEVNDLTIAHYDTLRQRFKELLATPDNRADLVTQFQKEFNAVDVDARRQKQTQAELVLRSEELRESLWALCDKKLDTAEAERTKIANDSFTTDQSTSLAQHYISLAQVEIDRFYATLGFIKGIVPVKHGVLQETPAGEQQPTDVTSTPPDLLSGVVPVELKDKIDEKSKTVMPMPQVVSQLASKSSALATALKVAIAASTAAVASMLPPAEEVQPKKAAQAAKKEAGKNVKGSTPAEVPPAIPQHITDAITADLASLASEESRIIQDRLLLVAQQAASAFEGLAQLNAANLNTLSSWTKACYEAECSTVLALDRVIKAAALSGEQLSSQLRFEDNNTTLTIDHTAVVVPPKPSYPPPKPRERQPPTSALTVAQLQTLTQYFLPLAPQGLCKIGECAEVFLRSAGEGTLPNAWQSATAPALQAALRLLDPTHTGYVDWRQAVVCLCGMSFPRIPQASCAEVAASCQALLEADQDKDGLLSETEWLSTDLWFQRPRVQQELIITPATTDGTITQDVQPQTEAQTPALEPQPQAVVTVEVSAAEQEVFDRAKELKKVLWAAFATPAPSTSPAAGLPRLDIHAVLLYLSADADLFSGIKKAFSALTANPASNARIDASQLFKVCYPYGCEAGQAIHRCPFTAEQLQEVVDKISKSRNDTQSGVAQITAEQLMYSSFGEKVVYQLLDRYHVQDLYVATKLALY